MDIIDKIKMIEGVTLCTVHISEEINDKRIWIKVAGGCENEIAKTILDFVPLTYLTVGNKSVKVDLLGFEYKVNFTHIRYSNLEGV